MIRTERKGVFPNERDFLIADTTAELEASTPATEIAFAVALDTGLAWTHTAGNGWKAGGGSGGGTSVTLTVVLSDVVSNRLTATWDNPGNASLFQVFLRDGGVSTYIEPETSNLSVEIPLPVSQVDRTVSVEVYSLDGCGTASAVVPASTVLPNVAFRIHGENMEFSAAVAADATQYTYSTNLRNDEPFPITHAATILASIADPPMAYVALGYKGASWVVDNAPPLPPTGGGVIPGDTRPTPMIAISDLMAIPAGIPPGGYMPYETCPDTTGYLSPVYRSIGEGSTTLSLKTHPSGEYVTDRRMAGNVVGSDPSGGSAYGPSTPLLLLKYGSTNGVPASYHNVACFGDSTFAQVRSPVATERSREGIFYQANHALAAANRKLRFASFGEGSSKFTCIQHRLERLAPLLNQYCQSVLWQLPTANQPFTSVGQYEALWQTFLTISALIRIETGMLVHAAISTPPASFSQTQVNLDGYAYIAARIAEAGGINLAPVLGGTVMPIANSNDGAHLNANGVAVAYPELVTQALALYGGLGVDV